MGHKTTSDGPAIAEAARPERRRAAERGARICFPGRLAARRVGRGYYKAAIAGIHTEADRIAAGGCASAALHTGVLAAVAKQVIHQHQGHHGLGNGRGADANTGVVAAGGHHLHRLAMNVQAAPRLGDA